MSNDDNQQYFITILNSNGEAINITPELLPEQLLPLVQKKQIKEEKIDISNLTSAYKKIFENLTENNSTSLGSISSLSNIINVNSANNSRIKLTTSDSNHNKNRDNVLSSSSSSIITSRSPLQTILLRSSNQNNHNLQSSASNDHNNIIPGSLSDNSNNYITTLQISQSNSNLPTLAFTQPQALLHYSNQNPDSPNTVLIPISLHNNNQFSQQQILVAAAAVASGGYNQNCNEGGSHNVHTSNSSSHHNLSTTSLAKLISGNVTNPLSINLGNVMKSNSANSDISPSSKSSTNKRKFDMNTTDEFGRRKEMRLLKNREAARECRRKKKEYVKCLEARVSNLEEQNKVLVDEINRMKELYAKKISKRPSNPPSEVDNKYLEVVYPSDNPMKEYYEISGGGGGGPNDCDQQNAAVVKAKSSYPGTHSMTLTSIGNIGLTSSVVGQVASSGPNQQSSKYVTSNKDLDSTTITRVVAPQSHLVNKKDNNNSQLSVLLVGGGGGGSNVKFSNQSYPSNPQIIYPDCAQETKNIDDDDEDDDDDSNSPCD